MAKPKKTLIVSIIIIIAIALVAVCLMLFYSDTVKRVLNDEVTSYLQEVTKQEATIIETQVNGDLSTLESLATLLGDTYTSEAELYSDESIKLLLDIKEQNGFKRMGIITADGNAATTDRINYNFTSRDYFQKAMRGIPNVSSTFADATDGESINVYAVPIYFGNVVNSVLFATHKTNVFENKISVSTFNGSGYSYVVQSDGARVAASHHKDSSYFENIFDLLQNGKLRDPYGEFISMRTNMAHGKSGVIYYIKSDVPYYMSYAPIGVNDWYVVASVPSSVAAAKSSFLITLTAWISGIIVSTVVVLLLYILISQNKSRKSLERIAYTDDLTGSASWMKFRSECHDTLRAHPEQTFALINFDINKFKIFNQLYNYQHGNLLIQNIARVLEKDMHENELYSHTGADDFDVIIRYVSESDIIGRILKWNQQIKDFDFTHKRNYNLMLSYGIYKVPQGSSYATRMSDLSKIAKNSIKNNSHTLYAFYDETINHEMLREKELENNMDAALSGGEFEVYYQPQFNLETGTPVAAEALIRWRSPEKGFMSPAAFIPVFERNGFITKIDMYVLDKVCATLRNRINKGESVMPISINLSRLNMYSDDFVSQLSHVQNRYEIPSELLEFELTESALSDTDNDDLIINRMSELKSAGFKISIDDFGTGYSSLNLLRTLPVSIIKLDRLFFTHSIDNIRERIIIKSVISMAQQLGITVIAEGVETQAQADFLKTISKNIIVQGFLYARPMPTNDFLSLLDTLK
ncbi:MAG: EAL domain-containing protein [Christensenella sp.]